MTFFGSKFWNGSAGGLRHRHGVPGIVIVKQQLRLSRDSPWGPVWVSHESSEQSDCSRDSAGLQHQCQNWKLCLSFLSQPWDWHSVTITVLWLLTTDTQFHPFQVDCGHVLKWAQRRFPRLPGAFFGVSKFLSNMKSWGRWIRYHRKNWYDYYFHAGVHLKTVWGPSKN